MKKMLLALAILGSFSTIAQAQKQSFEWQVSARLRSYDAKLNKIYVSYGNGKVIPLDLCTDAQSGYSASYNGREMYLIQPILFVLANSKSTFENNIEFSFKAGEKCVFQASPVSSIYDL